MGKTKKGKSTTIMIVTDGEGLPLAAHIDSASPAEVTLLETTLDKVAVGRKGKAGTVRWERHDFIYAGFVHLACAFLVMRRA